MNNMEGGRVAGVAVRGRMGPGTASVSVSE